MAEPFDAAHPPDLRARSRECIELAVEAPEAEGVDALIDLAEDYMRSAEYYEKRRTLK